MTYSAILINRNSRRLLGQCDRVADPLEMPEFTIVAHHYLGPIGEYITLLAVALIILCFVIVAYILLGQDQFNIILTFITNGLISSWTPNSACFEKYLLTG